MSPQTLTGINDWQERRLHRTVAGAAGFVAALGFALAALWLGKDLGLVTVFSGIFQVKLNTALLFVACGTGLIAALRRASRIALGAAAIAVLVSALTLLEYTAGLDFGIDELWVKDVYDPNTPRSGRIAPYTSLAFLFAGLSLIWAIKNSWLPSWRISAMELLGFLVFSLGAQGLLGHMEAIELAYGWGSQTRMAVYTSLGFIGLGAGLMALTWRMRDTRTARIPLWLPALLCFLVLMTDLATPRGVATGIAYIPLVFCGLWFARPHAAFVFAAIATVLAVIGFFAKAPGEVATSIVLMNRLLTIGALWFVAILVFLRRNTEMTLKKTEEKVALMANIVESSDDAIIAMTLGGKVDSWNAGAQRLFGYSAAEIVGRSGSLLVPEDLREEEEAILQQLQQGKPIIQYETLRLHKGGRIFDVSVNLSPIRDLAGKITGTSKIARDITERRRTEERFRLVVESNPSAIVMIDQEGRIVLVNTQTEKMFGYTRDELLGQMVELLVPERYRNHHAGYRTGFFANPSMRSMGVEREIYGQRKDGSEFPIEIGLNPLPTSEGLMVLSATVDITERKEIAEETRKFNEQRTAELKAVNNDLEEFAYAASHDLKAPLRVIDNASKWLEEDLHDHLTEETRENIALMRSRIVRMGNLLDDLLEYSRIGRNVDERYTEIIAGDALMENIQVLLSPPQGFTLKVSPSFAGIQLLRMPLQQILMNLISNSLKHHDKPKGNIEVTVENSGEHYTFAVKDDGPGIAPQFHEQIFKMFKTLKPRDQVEGSGMGLAMVRKNIEVFGGTISVESSEGTGSIFRFTWPIQQQSKRRAA